MFALDYGLQLQAIVHIDAGAALPVTQFQGFGKIEHVAAHWLWIGKSEGWRPIHENGVRQGQSC